MSKRLLGVLGQSLANLSTYSLTQNASCGLAASAFRSSSVSWSRLFSGDSASTSFASSYQPPQPEAANQPQIPPSSTDAPPVPEGMSLHLSGATLDFSAPALKNPDPLAVVHVSTTKNNTIITLSDLTGRTRTWSSGGTVGERNSRKGTSFAAELAAQTVGKRAMELGLDVVKVKIKGIGQGRDSSIKGLKMAGVRIVKITDVTPIPHNGCRPPKRRRT